MKQLIKAYNLFYIFMAIIWQPFQIYILKVDGAGRAIMVLSILAIVLNLYEFWKQKKVFTSLAFICWTVLLCYSMWNAFNKGFYAENGTFVFLRNNFFDTFVLLLIMMLELKESKYLCLWVIWLALGVYLLVGLPSFIQNPQERFSVEGIGNLYPLNTVAFLFVSSVLFVEEKLKLPFFVAAIVAASGIILLSGTRKAFGAEVIILLGVVLTNKKKRNFWAWLRILVFGGVLAFGVHYVMNNTIIGERIFESEDNEQFYVQLVKNEQVNDFLMVLLGDRAGQYEVGIELFHEHFWTGIGLTNYGDIAGSDMVLHSEYMVQLCENGIIGFVLLMLFYVIIIVGFIKSRIQTGSKKLNVVLFGLFAVLFINLTAWTYCQTYIMVFYAIVFSYVYADKNNIIITNNVKKNSHTSSREQFQRTLDRIFEPASDRV